MVAVGLALLLAVGGSPADSAEQVQCTFDPDSRQVHVSAPQNTSVTLIRGGDGDSLSDPLLVEGKDCGDATVSSADTVKFDQGNPVVDLRGGPFAPGHADEPGDTDEIEMDVFGDVTVTGTEGADHLVQDYDGVNLNEGSEPTARDNDISKGQDITFEGLGGDDIISGSAPGTRFGSRLTASGGSGDDELTGSASQDTIDGGPGADQIDGAQSQDTLTGGPGDDVVIGGSDADDSDDLIAGGPGDDRLAGGGNQLQPDVLDFSTATGPVVADMGAGTVAADGEGGTDVIEGFEAAIGGADDDRITGTEGPDELFGHTGGNDVLSGAGGDDLISGSPGVSELDGGEGDDELRAAGTDNELSGGVGDDLLVARYGRFQDDFDGGPGRDQVQKNDLRSADVDLTEDSITFHDGSGSEDLAGVEDIVTDTGDVVQGDAGPNRISGTGRAIGGPGDDELLGVTADYSESLVPILGEDHEVNDGLGGIDHVTGTVIGSRFPDRLVNLGPRHIGGAGDDVLSGGHAEGGPGDDILTGSEDDDELDGGDGNDQTDGLAGRDLILGGPGVDLIDGGADTDKLSYEAAPAAVAVDLADGTAQDGYGGLDSITEVEHVDGSSSDDQIRGDDGVNTLNGGVGDDDVSGRGGDDRISAFSSGDKADGGAGDDRLMGSGVLSGGPGDDRFEGENAATVDYSSAPAGVRIKPSDSRLTAEDGDGGTDTIELPRTLVGSPHDDEIEGAFSTYEVFGGAGDDVIRGVDRVDLGPGRDTVFTTPYRDEIDARDGENDTIDCGEDENDGDDSDYLRADDLPLDGDNGTCEDIDRTSDGDHGPTATPEPTPAPRDDPPAAGSAAEPAGQGQAAAPSASSGPTARVAPARALARLSVSSPERQTLRISLRARGGTRVLLRVERRTGSRWVRVYSARRLVRTGSLTIRVKRSTSGRRLRGGRYRVTVTSGAERRRATHRL